jgi:hypothetical protein
MHAETEPVRVQDATRGEFRGCVLAPDSSHPFGNFRVNVAALSFHSEQGMRGVADAVYALLRRVSVGLHDCIRGLLELSPGLDAFDRIGIHCISRLL